MARIRQTTATPALPRPTARPEQFGALEGQALQQLAATGKDIATKLTARATQAEITKANATAALAQAELTNQLREGLRTADPDDLEFSDRFMNEVVGPRMDALEEIGNTATAIAHISKLRAGITGHFITSTAKGQADLAGQAAVLSYEETLNQLSNTVGTDPAALDISIELADLVLEDMVQRGSLAREDALKLQAQSRETIALSAASAMIAQNPGGTKQLINDGLFNEYLDGKQKSQLLSMATTAEKSLEVEARRQREDAAKTASSDHLESMIDDKGNIRATPDTLLAIAQDPRYDTPEGATEQRTVFNMVRTILKTEGEGAGKIKTNPAVFRDLWSRSMLAPGIEGRPTRQEVMGFAGRGLTVTDMNQILKNLDDGFSPVGEVNNTLRDQFERSARAFLATQRDVTRPDPLGEQSLGNFLSWALPEALRLEEAGTPLADIYASDGPLMGRIQDYAATREEIRGRGRLIRRGQRFEPLARPVEPGLRSPEQLQKLLDEAE